MDDSSFIDRRKEWRPVLSEGDSPISAVFQALGAASSCWENLSGAGVFDSTYARVVGDGLIAYLREHPIPPDTEQKAHWESNDAAGANFPEKPAGGIGCWPPATDDEGQSWPRSNNL